MSAEAPRTCGLLFCYNEEQILADTLAHYLGQGIDLVVFDNCSTDRSRELVHEADGCWPGVIRDLVQVTTDGYEWQRILETACTYLHQHLASYDWIMLIDADAFYHSPVQGLSLLEYMEIAHEHGWNVLDGQLLELFPTEQDDASISSPTRRLQYYEPSRTGAAEYPQHKIFRYHPSIDFFTDFGHICRRDKLRLCPVRFLYLHYKWVSYEHGLQKIFTDRLPRFGERRRHARFHPQYLGLLPLRRDLVKQASSLRRYHEAEHQISQQELLATVRPAALPAEQAGASPAAVDQLYPRPRARAPFWTITEQEWAQQRPFADGLPKRYHLLMTDSCNASCLFCNQDLGAQRQLSLDDVTQLLANIPPTSELEITLSGGGEPLLCRELFAIIDHLHQVLAAPAITIKSNGLLVGARAEQLARAKIARLGMSVHGATMEQNNRVLRARNPRLDVFAGVARLNRYLHELGNPMRKIFYLITSRLNINELPALVRRAAELQVHEVMVIFSRYLPIQLYPSGRRPEADPADSLFYHRDLYNKTVLEAKQLAETLGVFLRHEPLFGEPFTPAPCLQPWHTMVVRWDGQIFPCTGGEVWFRETVARQTYDFGNLLEQHLSTIWNNESYTRIRRTLGPHSEDDLVPECRLCHNTCCFLGPELEAGHLLRAP